MSSLTRRIPKPVRSHLRAIKEGAPLARLASTPATVRTIHRLECSTAHWGPGEENVSLRLRPLNGARIWVRPRTADLYAVKDTLIGRYHVPPVAPGDPTIRRIWDLGTNIGMTVAHYAVLFPQARIQGVEMDAANATLARRNTATWADRVDILQSAVWATDGEIEYEREEGEELSFRAEEATGAGGGTRLTSPAISLNTLAARWGDDAPIDLVKMDIEGVERHVLSRDTEWAARVRIILVEVHEPYDVDACCRDLAALGFDASPDDRHHAAVVGLRLH